MKSNEIPNRVLTLVHLTALTITSCGFYACSFRTVPIQMEMVRPFMPTPTASPKTRANTESRTSQREQVELVVREYCRLALQGRKGEIERIIQIIPPKQPTLSDKEKRSGATVPNFSIIADLERANLLEDTPRWIALGSESIVSLKVEFASQRSASVTTLFRSPELPEISRSLVFKLSENGSGWKINGVVWEFVNESSEVKNESAEITGELCSRSALTVGARPNRTTVIARK